MLIGFGVYVDAGELNFSHSGLVSSQSHLNSSDGEFHCWTNMTATCPTVNGSATVEYSGVLANSSLSLVSNSDISVGEGVRVIGEVVIMCADIINVSTAATISASGLGCLVNDGVVAGTPPTGDIGGGGGGGSAGGGGQGAEGNAGGGSTERVFYTNTSSGSGGGWSNSLEQKPFAGTGGGIVYLMAAQGVHVDGVIAANGISGGYFENTGGGGGGSIFVQTPFMSGVGSVVARGGQGGVGNITSSSFGGGGGGGYIIIDQLTSDTGFDFGGSFLVPGGQPGQSAPTGTGPGGQPGQSAPAGTGVVGASTLDAEYGSDGYVQLPVCYPGYGNTNQGTGVACELCLPGTYSTASDTSPCSNCTNKPSHSSYSGSGMDTANCGFKCNSGFVTTECVTPFFSFLNMIGGQSVFIILLVALFVVLVVPVVYYRYKRIYGWGEAPDANWANNQNKYFEFLTMFSLESREEHVIQKRRTEQQQQYSIHSFETASTLNPMVRDNMGRNFTEEEGEAVVCLSVVWSCVCLSVVVCVPSK